MNSTRSRGRLLAALTVMLFALAARTASAQPSGDSRARATELLHQGNDLFGEGTYVEALAKFKEAYALFPSSRLLLNIGTTQRLLGRNGEAASTYEHYLAQPDRDPARVAEVQRILTEIDGVVGRLHVKTTTPGARVTVDSIDLGIAPLDRTIRVEVGPHKVVAEKVGMQAFVTSIAPRAGQSAEVVAEPLPPGVILKTNTVTVESGQPQRIAGAVVGSVGIAVGIVGFVFGGLALSANNDASAHCAKDPVTACDAKGVELGNTASSRATISTALLSVGGGVLLGGVIVFATAPLKKVIAPSTRPTVGLGIGTDGSGAVGRFRMEF